MLTIAAAVRPAPASPRWPAARTRSRAVRLSAMIPAVKRGDAVAESAGGEPPALLTSTSSRPNRCEQSPRSPRRPGRARARRRRRTASRRAGRRARGGSRRDVRARVGEALRDPASDAAAPAGDDHGLPVEAKSSIGRASAHRGRSVRSDAAVPRLTIGHPRPNARASTSARSRQTRHDRRHRRRGARRHDRRHRRLGLAPQADGARARAAAGRR